MGKQKKSKAEIIETDLSKQQLDILKNREAFYQDFTLPALKDYYNATSQFNLRDDFNTLDDLTSQIDTIFSSDPEKRVLGQQLMQGGFDSQTSQLAQERLQGEAAGGREQVFSQANLAQILQGNQATSQRNQAAVQEQSVRTQGVDALLGQAPRPTGAGTPSFLQGQGGQGDPLTGAAGGALGSLLQSDSFAGLFQPTMGMAPNANTSTDFLSGPDNF
jgi:hypothetical protein